MWNLGLLGASGALAYELIESVNLSVAAASLTFSNIPQNYKHLELRLVTKSSGTDAGVQNFTIYYNDIQTSNQASHLLYGNGSSVFSSNVINWDSQYVGITSTSYASDFPTGAFGSTIINVLDYSSTAKNKTTRTLTGVLGSGNSSVRVGLYSSLLESTNAINKIKISVPNISWVANSRFSLYGIKG